MRHFLLKSLTVATLAIGMKVAATTTGLITLRGLALGLQTGFLGASSCTIDVAPITATANNHLTSTAGTVVESSTVLHRQIPSDKNWTRF
jgi:hypothetical protein